MSFFSNLSIRWKLTVIIMLTTCVALQLVCACMLVYDVVSTRRATEHYLAALGDVLGRNSAAALLFGDAQAGTETLAALRAEPRVACARLFNREGAPFASYSRPDYKATLPGQPRSSGA